MNGDDTDKTASERLQLGISYFQEGKVDEARTYWEGIRREDDAEQYAKARFNLGLSYSEEGKVDEARTYWEDIRLEDDAEQYAKARLCLGGSYFKEGNEDKARTYWEGIRLEDDADAYAKARLCLGFSYSEEGNEDKARTYWESIRLEDDADAYAKARFCLGSSYSEERKVDEARTYWENLVEALRVSTKDMFNDQWFSYIIHKINSFISKNQQKIANGIELYDFLYQLKSGATLIRKKLHMNPDLFTEERIEHVDFQKLETAFAHYTKAEIAEKIIENGSFHLGIANYMNDPTEGKLLLNEWKIPTDYNDDSLVFLTSFTFNDNSLNQFRLYGKESGKEGSGVSLVVANTFFDSEFDSEKLAYMNTDLLYQIPYQDITNSYKLAEKNSKIKADNIIKKLSNSLPIFRCIYIDPNTNYISVAHQSKSSFLSKRSFYLEEDKIENIEDVWEKVWRIYIARMDEITKDVKAELEKIQQTIGEIQSKIEHPELSHQNEIYEAIATTLLPIIYLTKHAAFEEEAECRILYVTSIFDKVVQRDGDRVYVEYATNLADQYQQDGQSYNYLQRIYLGPKADPRVELTLKKCWIDKMQAKEIKENKIKIPTIKKSDMPLA